MTRDGRGGMIDRSGPQKKQNTRIMSMKPCALFRRQILALLAFALVICGAPAARATERLARKASG